MRAHIHTFKTPLTRTLDHSLTVGSQNAVVRTSSCTEGAACAAAFIEDRMKLFRSPC